MRRLPALLLLAALAGCSLVGDDYDDYLDEQARLVAELDRLVGAAEAETLDACRVVSFGGGVTCGPPGYRVYSTTATDAAALEALADRITRLERDAGRRFDLAYPCVHIEPPRPALVGGRCVAAAE